MESKLAPFVWGLLLEIQCFIKLNPYKPFLLMLGKIPDLEDWVSDKQYSMLNMFLEEIPKITGKTYQGLGSNLGQNFLFVPPNSEGVLVFSTYSYESSLFQARNTAWESPQTFSLHAQRSVPASFHQKIILCEGKAKQKGRTKAPMWRAEDLLQHMLSEMNTKWQQPPANTWKLKYATQRKWSHKFFQQ